MRCARTDGDPGTAAYRDAHARPHGHRDTDRGADRGAHGDLNT
jgi:hypothetical protein